MFKAVSGQSDFPKIEEANLKFWQEHDTFRKSVQNRKGNPEYIFYDGPRLQPVCRIMAICWLERLKM